MNEFRLIGEFTGAFRSRPPPRGPGDDCAVLPRAAGPLCVTTDSVVEHVHFTRQTFALEDVGHKALAVNLSDLAAMGARPAWAVCSLMLPQGTGAREVRALARGMAGLARAHRIELVGGNISSASELSVTITAGGSPVSGRRPLLRSGAKPGDTIYLSGATGDAAAGLALLGRRPSKTRLERRATEHLRRAQRRPAPHVALGLAVAPYASACIDVSDGLLQDLAHLAEASGVGADISTWLLPLSNALLTVCGDLSRAVELALGGGEDYVLLFTVPPGRVSPLQRALRRSGFTAFRIGQVTARGGLRVDGRPTRPRGFMHFR